MVRCSDLLTGEAVVFGVEYIFYREVYLQQREYLVTDGNVDDAFEDGF